MPVKSQSGRIFDYGPGYRAYFVRRGRALVILLAGGDKDSLRQIGKNPGIGRAATGRYGVGHGVNDGIRLADDPHALEAA